MMKISTAELILDLHAETINVLVVTRNQRAGRLLFEELLDTIRYTLGTGDVSSRVAAGAREITTANGSWVTFSTTRTWFEDVRGTVLDCVVFASDVPEPPQHVLDYLEPAFVTRPPRPDRIMRLIDA
jgi:hypothetical protein